MSLEHHQILAAFNRAANHYEKHAVLQKEAMLRLMDRVESDLKLPPKTTLDLGCGTGWACQPLLELYPKTHIIAVDFAANMLAQINTNEHITTRTSDAHCIDIGANSVDLVYSNLMLQWCNEDTVFKEIKRALKPGGIMHITTMGEHTLHELKSAWRNIDEQPHVNDFTPATKLADLLFKNGFEEVVADSELITMTYNNLIDLMRDIKNIGAHNTDHKRKKGLSTSYTIKRLNNAYQQFVENNIYPATYELVYLRAKKPLSDKQLNVKIKP